MRKINILLIIAIFILAVSPSFAQGSDWALSALELYEDKVDFIKDNYSDEITRLEFAELINMTYGIIEVDPSISFEDTKDSEALKAASAGLLVGDGVNFNPTDTLTREQLVKVLANYIELTGGDLPTADLPSKFTDKSEISSWAKKEMGSIYKLGLIKGRSETTLNPKGTLTMEEACVFLERVSVKLSAAPPTEEETKNKTRRNTATLQENVVVIKETGDISEKDYVKYKAGDESATYSLSFRDNPLGLETGEKVIIEPSLAFPDGYMGKARVEGESLRLEPVDLGEVIDTIDVKRSGELNLGELNVYHFIDNIYRELGYTSNRLTASIEDSRFLDYEKREDHIFKAKRVIYKDSVFTELTLQQKGFYSKDEGEEEKRSLNSLKIVLKADLGEDVDSTEVILNDLTEYEIYSIETQIGLAREKKSGTTIKFKLYDFSFDSEILDSKNYEGDIPEALYYDFNYNMQVEMNGEFVIDTTGQKAKDYFGDGFAELIDFQVGIAATAVGTQVLPHKIEVSYLPVHLGLRAGLTGKIESDITLSLGAVTNIFTAAGIYYEAPDVKETPRYLEFKANKDKEFNEGKHSYIINKDSEKKGKLEAYISSKPIGENYLYGGAEGKVTLISGPGARLYLGIMPSLELITINGDILGKVTLNAQGSFLWPLGIPGTELKLRDDSILKNITEPRVYGGMSMSFVPIFQVGVEVLERFKLVNIPIEFREFTDNSVSQKIGLTFLEDTEDLIEIYNNRDDYQVEDGRKTLQVDNKSLYAAMLYTNFRIGELLDKNSNVKFAVKRDKSFYAGTQEIFAALDKKGINYKHIDNEGYARKVVIPRVKLSDILKGESTSEETAAITFSYIHYGDNINGVLAEILIEEYNPDFTTKDIELYNEDNYLMSSYREMTDSHYKMDYNYIPNVKFKEGLEGISNSHFEIIPRELLTQQVVDKIILKEVPNFNKVPKESLGGFKVNQTLNKSAYKTEGDDLVLENNSDYKLLAKLSGSKISELEMQVKYSNIETYLKDLKSKDIVTTKELLPNDFSSFEELDSDLISYEYYFKNLAKIKLEGNENNTVYTLGGLYVGGDNHAPKRITTNRYTVVLNPTIEDGIITKLECEVEYEFNKDTVAEENWLTPMYLNTTFIKSFTIKQQLKEMGLEDLDYTEDYISYKDSFKMTFREGYLDTITINDNYGDMIMKLHENYVGGPSNNYTINNPLYDSKMIIKGNTAKIEYDNFSELPKGFSIDDKSRYSTITHDKDLTEYDYSGLLKSLGTQYEKMVGDVSKHAYRVTEDEIILNESSFIKVKDNQIVSIRLTEKGLKENLFGFKPGDELDLVNHKFHINLSRERYEWNVKDEYRSYVSFDYGNGSYLRVDIEDKIIKEVFYHSSKTGIKLDDKYKPKDISIKKDIVGNRFTYDKVLSFIQDNYTVDIFKNPKFYKLSEDEIKIGSTIRYIFTDGILNEVRMSRYPYENYRPRVETMAGLDLNLGMTELIFKASDLGFEQDFISKYDKESLYNYNYFDIRGDIEGTEFKMAIIRNSWLFNSHLISIKFIDEIEEVEILEPNLEKFLGKSKEEALDELDNLGVTDIRVDGDITLPNGLADIILEDGKVSAVAVMKNRYEEEEESEFRIHDIPVTSTRSEIEAIMGDEYRVEDYDKKDILHVYNKDMGDYILEVQYYNTLDKVKVIIGILKSDEPAPIEEDLGPTITNKEKVEAYLGKDKSKLINYLNENNIEYEVDEDGNSNRIFTNEGVSFNYKDNKIFVAHIGHVTSSTRGIDPNTGEEFEETVINNINPEFSSSKFSLNDSLSDIESIATFKGENLYSLKDHGIEDEPLYEYELLEGKYMYSVKYYKNLDEVKGIIVFKSLD